jgi:uncharacterized protein YjbI with pentapeptide repeats
MAKQSKVATKKSAAKKAAPQKAAAQKTASNSPGSSNGKLHGQSVAFVGKFGYKDMNLSNYEPLVLAHGGTLVKTDAPDIDYLFVGEGRGGNPPGDVAKIQNRLPAVNVLNEADFQTFLLPSADELLRELQQGRRDGQHRYWDGLRLICLQTQTLLDLTDAKLQGFDLHGAELYMVKLHGSDLRKATAEYTNFGDLENANFAGAAASKAYFCDLEHCNFRQADLTEAWMFHERSRIMGQRSTKLADQCDFTEANMQKARMENGKFTKCQFTAANLSDAQAEKTKFDSCDFQKADLSRINASDTKFTNADFRNANLHRADLRKASLAGVDLRNANLREAILSGVDFTGANLAGADFQDAVLTKAKLDGVDFSKAKNFKLPEVRKAGPKLREFAKTVAGSKKFETSAQIYFSPSEIARLEVVEYHNGAIFTVSQYERDGQDIYDRQHPKSIEQGLLDLADRWPQDKLRLDSITAAGCKTLRGQKLLDLAIAAWAEAFGIDVESPEALAEKVKQQQANTTQERDEIVKSIRAQGQKFWDDLSYQKRREVDLRGVDFSKAKLDKIEFYSSDLKGTNFAGASLVEANLSNAQCKQTDFSKAKMRKCTLNSTVLAGAKFQQSDLTEAIFYNAKLQGADFTAAILTDALFEKAHYDQTTIWPQGFELPAKMLWKGDGPAPNIVQKPIVAAKVGSLDFETFLKDLGAKVETARLDKAGSMLKAERFQLFAEVKDTGIVGIVKSQSSGDLVYSCRLNSDGAFGCCTQNLRPCGGLRGALCKHLLVLIVGLAKAGQLDPATVNQWADLSTSHKPAIDEEAMSATFLRYKGAESGELDWRPTETIPEDFYAM